MAVALAKLIELALVLLSLIPVECGRAAA